MAVTLKDVALRAGVSASAVSRSFTEGASVSAKTRRKVEKAAHELGYRPNVLASSLTTRRTKLIGLVSNNFHNPVFLQVFDLFTQSLQEKGLRPLLVNLSGEVDPAKSLDMLLQYSVDGVIVASSTLPPDFAESFRHAKIPVVHSFGRCSATPTVHTVGIDNRYAGELAAQLLVSKGFKHIGFLGGPENATSTQDRLIGFKRVLSEYPNIKFSVNFAEDYSYGAGRKAMQSILIQDHAEAYFCGDDVLTIGALSAAQTAGLKVPEEIGFIGFNNMEMAGWANINLTTIHQPVQEIISSSVELLVDCLDDPDRIPETRMFPCRVVERGTLLQKVT
ncbi:transcriptional regulator, LacI family [Pseudovibrio ascidiaceicola]|uniref:Transcriptional regulator, LacI family n=1 Tax=Pseudovibrio ascidiaceicola TaxID=285279 RepID=A0A1I4FPW0_9HYPH|nr:LacI family DNA-binding transcriptional regulator [Pseudovibrio ascidiaceicola]SFL19864.1 transcriptional regulator, LacI family [Pseudovibrio ascidiaceicola]